MIGNFNEVEQAPWSLAREQGDQIMTIGIIGAGSIGAAFARKLAQASIPAILSNSHGPDSLADLVADIGGVVRAGTRNEAAAQDLVLVAVNWSKLACRASRTVVD